MLFDSNLEILLLEYAKTENLSFNDLRPFIISRYNKLINEDFYNELFDFLQSINFTKTDIFISSLKIFFFNYEDIIFALDNLNNKIKNVNLPCNFLISYKTKTDFY